MNNNRGYIDPDTGAKTCILCGAKMSRAEKSRIRLLRFKKHISKKAENVFGDPTEKQKEMRRYAKERCYALDRYYVAPYSMPFLILHIAGVDLLFFYAIYQFINYHAVAGFKFLGFTFLYCLGMALFHPLVELANNHYLLKKFGPGYKEWMDEVNSEIDRRTKELGGVIS